MRRFVCSFAIVFLLAAMVAGQKLEPPKLEPTKPTESQLALIREAVALHDKGDYDGAIERYLRVLKESPDCVAALYEMSFSYYAKKDYQKSIETGYKAAQYKSDLLAAIYVQIGTCVDELGNSKQAIEVYKSGIKMNPSDALLHYNLGVTYARTGQLDDSRAVLKKAAVFDPNHKSSQLLLSTVFDKGNYRIPALLAACRFLILEPNSTRSERALKSIQQIMGAGVYRKSEKEINIFVEEQQKKDEGDFGPVDLFLKLSKAANYAEENKNKTEMELLIHNFESLFAVLSETTVKEGSKFTWKYYAPYFVELKKQGYTETFVYLINRRSGIAGVFEWLDQNQKKLADFLAWSRAYQWPKTD